jgi:hypothetical protein
MNNALSTSSLDECLVRSDGSCARLQWNVAHRSCWLRHVRADRFRARLVAISFTVTRSLWSDRCTDVHCSLLVSVVLAMGACSTIHHDRFIVMAPVSVRLLYTPWSLLAVEDGRAFHDSPHCSSSVTTLQRHALVRLSPHSPAPHCRSASLCWSQQLQPRLHCRSAAFADTSAPMCLRVEDGAPAICGSSRCPCNPLRLRSASCVGAPPLRFTRASPCTPLPVLKCPASCRLH